MTSKIMKWFVGFLSFMMGTFTLAGIFILQEAMGISIFEGPIWIAIIIFGSAILYYNLIKKIIGVAFIGISIKIFFVIMLDVVLLEIMVYTGLNIIDTSNAEGFIRIIDGDYSVASVIFCLLLFGITAWRSYKFWEFKDFLNIYPKSMKVAYFISSVFYSLSIAMVLAVITPLNYAAFLAAIPLTIVLFIYQKRDGDKALHEMELLKEVLLELKNRIISTTDQIKAEFRRIDGYDLGYDKRQEVKRAEKEFDFISYIKIDIQEDDIMEIPYYQTRLNELINVLNELMQITEADSLNKEKKGLSLNLFEGCETIRDLKKRRAKLAHIYHPDSETGNEELFRAIEDEYEKLRNKLENRNEYSF